MTFDDEFSTHVDVALPELRAQRVRATFFLTGAQLDGPAPFWWELLQEAADRGVSTQRLIPGDDIFEQAAHVTAAPPARRAEIAAALSSLSPLAAARTMPPEDIARLAAEHDIAFHTLHHHRLDTLTAPQLKAALRDGREKLERLVARPLTLLAYPHGIAGPREATAARQAGFTLGFTTIWEPCSCTSDPLLIGRIEPGPVSSSGFLETVSQTLSARVDSG